MTERARDLHEHDEREEKHTRHSQTSTSRSFQTVTFRQHTRGRNAPRPAAVTHATPVAVHGPPKFAWHRNSPPADVLRHGPCGPHHRVGIRIPTRALERHLTGHRATRGSNQQSRMEVIRGRVRSRFAHRRNRTGVAGYNLDCARFPRPVAVRRGVSPRR